MKIKFSRVAAAAALTAFLAVPASAGQAKLGLLSCDIDGGTGYVITSHKGLSCTFKPSRGGGREHYTGIISSSASILASHTRVRSNGLFSR